MSELIVVGGMTVHDVQRKMKHIMQTIAKYKELEAKVDALQEELEQRIRKCQQTN